MGRRQNMGCCLVALVFLQLALPALALPQLFNKVAEQGTYTSLELNFFFIITNHNTSVLLLGRKFAVKPNSNKKVITETNEIAVNIFT